MNVERAPQGGLARAVVFNPYNIILIVAAVGFSLALNSRVPAVIGAFAECLWLIVGASSSRFRRWAVRHEIEQGRVRRAAEIEQVARNLEPAYAARVRTLDELGTDIRRLMWERRIEGALLIGVEDRLEAPLLAFAKMAALHQRLARVTNRSSASQLEEEILGLGQSLSLEQDPAVRVLFTRALSVAQQRLVQKEQLDNQLRGLGVRMGTIEMSFDYLHSHIVSGRSEKDLASEVQDLVASLNFVSEMEAEANAFFARADAGPPTLSSLPAIPSFVPMGSMGPMGTMGPMGDGSAPIIADATMPYQTQPSATPPHHPQVQPWPEAADLRGVGRKITGEVSPLESPASHQRASNDDHPDRSGIIDPRRWK